ncbi:MAG: DnaJ domain-containing protein [Sodaliphilus sp.]
MDTLISGNKNNDKQRRNTRTYAREEQIGFDDFLYNLIFLSADVIFADGRIYESETAFLRSSLTQSFGTDTAIKGMNVFTRLKELRRSGGPSQWDRMMAEVCERMRGIPDTAARWQIVAFLADIAKSSGSASEVEIRRVREIATRMGFSSSSVDQFFALGGDSVDDAYTVLGISPNATDDEVRKAYKKMVFQNHPDRVAHLGEEVKNAATKKMQEINKAKEAIFKARKMK